MKTLLKNFTSPQMALLAIVIGGIAAGEVAYIAYKGLILFTDYIRLF